MSDFEGFDSRTFQFLRELERNNNREWFQANRQRYESDVREPARAFIRAFEGELEKISIHLVASDRKVGGSLMRVFRDTRFSKDRTPYKTNVGIHFRHELGGDVHTPGFYVHMAPGECFLGAGIWHPDSTVLRAIRGAIDRSPADWLTARDDRGFRRHFKLEGDSLKTAPRGFSRDHPLVDDLRRKDFIGVRHLEDREVLGTGFLRKTARAFQATSPFLRFLCEAINVPF